MNFFRLMGVLTVVLLLSQHAAADNVNCRTDVFFGFGSSVVPIEQKQKIREAVNQDARRYVLTGFTDAWAKKEFNWRLALDRVNAVAKELEQVGVNPYIIAKRIQGESWAYIQAPNKHKSSLAQSKNRRVQICVLKN